MTQVNSELEPYRQILVTNPAPAPLKPVSHSRAGWRLEQNASGNHGYGRGWGQATARVQAAVVDLIIEESGNLSSEDQAILLAMARLESGFNPDAAAGQSSASGIFQIIKKTAQALGLPDQHTFDARANIRAGIALYRQNMAWLKAHFPGLRGTDRAAMLYALHHDGPALNSDGLKIGRRFFLPWLERCREVLERIVAGK